MDKPITKETFTYSAVRQESDQAGQNNDCFVKAVALCFGMTYEEANVLTTECGRTDPNEGTQWKVIWKVFRRLVDLYDFNIKPVGAKSSLYLDDSPLRSEYRYIPTLTSGKTLKTFARRNPEGTFLVFCTGHATAVIDGVIEDWVTEGNGILKRPFLIFEIS